MTSKKWKTWLFACLGLLLLIFSGWIIFSRHQQKSDFDGSRAYQDVLAQVAFGARIPGSEAHEKTLDYISQELKDAGWQPEQQVSNWMGFPVTNLIATCTDEPAEYILGAHYDSRLLADMDTATGESGPVLGANDGASGVAVLLELARSLPHCRIPLMLVFFDAEDNGGLNGMEWIMGSRVFTRELTQKPHAAIIVDMVGDADLDLYIEKNSSADLARDIWAQAAELGYMDHFIPEPKYAILDDHIPFIESGIPAVDIIDFDYPYWHSTADTADKVSAKSLQIVGDTLWTWIVSQK